VRTGSQTKRQGSRGKSAPRADAWPGLPLPLIQRQLGHAYRSTTGTYLGGISSEEIIGAVHRWRAPRCTRALAARRLAADSV